MKSVFEGKERDGTLTVHVISSWRWVSQVLLAIGFGAIFLRMKSCSTFKYARLAGGFSVLEVEHSVHRDLFLLLSLV